MNPLPLETIAEAFSRTAEHYDSFALDHPHLLRLRHKVYSHLLRHVPLGAHILELNAGTGTDAVHLARQGYRVHATDIAPGMLDRLHEKVQALNLAGSITFEERSFLALEGTPGAPFDAVFSNLGGLNCIPDLSPVIRQVPAVLRPGGLLTWVLMPPLCLWEMAEIFRGNFSLAGRRFSGASVRAHLEGLQFDVYYFSPSRAIHGFGDAFELVALEGLSVLTPTAESKGFAKRYPRLYAALSWLDDRLSPYWPWRGMGDFFILTMRYTPG